MTQSKMSSSDAIEFILVHGTFAPNAPWCKPESQFCTALTEAFPNATFANFRWTGFNLHRARIRAGQRLAQHILRLERNEPGRQRIIIGHSHGGNVIRYALGFDGVAPCISSVIALATPFVEIEPRGFERILSWLLRLFKYQAIAVPAIGVISVVVMLAVVIDNDIVTRLMQKGAFATFIVLPVIGWLIKVTWSTYLQAAVTWVGRLVRRLQRNQVELFNTLAPPQIEGVPLLALAPVADEARRLLVTSARSTSLLGSPMPYAVAFAFLFPVIIFWLLGVRGDEFLGTMVFLGIPLGLALLPFALLAALVPAFHLPRGLHVPVFGEESIVETFVLRVTAHAGPLDWQPSVVEPVTVGKKFFQLRHCQVYETKSAIDKVIEWSSMPWGDYRDPISISKPVLAQDDFEIPRTSFDDRIPEEFHPHLPHDKPMYDPVRGKWDKPR